MKSNEQEKNGLQQLGQLFTLFWAKGLDPACGDTRKFQVSAEICHSKLQKRKLMLVLPISLTVAGNISFIAAFIALLQGHEGYVIDGTIAVLIGLAIFVFAWTMWPKRLGHATRKMAKAWKEIRPDLIECEVVDWLVRHNGLDMTSPIPDISELTEPFRFRMSLLRDKILLAEHRLAATEDPRHKKTKQDSRAKLTVWHNLAKVIGLQVNDLGSMIRDGVECTLPLE